MKRRENQRLSRGTSGARSRDLRIKSPQLYRLSYRPYRLASVLAASLVSLVYPSGSRRGKSHRSTGPSRRADTVERLERKAGKR